MIFHRERYILHTLVIAACIAVVAMQFVRVGQGDRLLELQVQSSLPTVVQVFYDTEHGFVPNVSNQRRIAGDNAVRTLRFSLPTSVNSVRIDFEAAAREIAIRKVRLVNILDGRTTPVDLKRLTALHHIKTISLDDTGAVVSAAGIDPQLALSWERDGRNTLQFYPGLIFSLTFMGYAALCSVSVFFSLVRRAVGGGRDEGSSSRLVGRAPLIIHGLFFSVGLLLWGTAGVYAWSDRDGRLSTPATGEHIRKEYQSPFRYHNVELKRPDGMRIAARVYEADSGDVRRPALLLLHGNYPQGQRYPLYPVLAQELAKRGYLVMTIDFAGYGRSEDPFASDRQRDVNLEPETRAALAYLAASAEVDAGHIGIIGHSMGADPALRVGIRSELVSTIMLIGPPRRVQQVFFAPVEARFFWRWAVDVGRQQYGREHFPDWYDKNRWRDDILTRDMAHMLPLLSRLHHKPVLFVDGERESKADKRFLASYVERCSFPKGYLTLPGADHNANVAAREGLIFYDPIVMEQLVATLDSWCKKTMSGRPDMGDYGRNLLRLLFSPHRFVWSE